ncbi:Protein transport protein sec73 [Apiospora saccharicola]|uniref:Protein transport protein sec73 n=1 Tax=Apiospora saccharicola TaxID=335842 RepID=A0ABR1UY16_9PEZI
MPFLRRRGIMASETDMRRHTVLDPGTGSGSGAATLPSRQSAAPRKSLAESLLRPGSSKLNARPSLDKAGEEERDSESRSGNGEGSSTETNALPATISEASDRPCYDDPFSRPDSPPIQEETPKHRRFSMLRFRNASDSQLSARIKQQQQQQQAEKPPPMPRPPAIITTAPTVVETSSPKKPRLKIPMRIRRSGDIPRTSQPDLNLKNTALKNDRRRSTAGISDFGPPSTRPSNENAPGKQTVTFQEPQLRPSSSRTPSQTEPPAYGDENVSALALPFNRLSESERSEGSASDHGVYGSTTTTTTTQTTSTTTFFRLPRRKQKQPEPLFPMGHLPQKNKTPALQPTASSSSLAPRDSTSADPPRPSTGGRSRTATPVASPSQSSTFLGKPSASPATALFRPGSRNSGQSSPTRAALTLRGRSSTMSSLGRASVEDRQFAGTARTSSSTGRKSFGDLLGISRLRQNQDNSRHGALTPATPGSSASKNNSLQLTREKEPVVMPERREDDTPAKYLNRLEEVLTRGTIASTLSKGTDPFQAAVLRSYMRTFGFFEEPMDIAIRKLLMEAELPKETQQIDRFLQAFANRYHECNPGIYSTPDQAYFIAFSLLILHTDVFNKNNKYKMQKPDYLKNTRGEGIFDDVLECFYDNITYTPFIHVEDDLDQKKTAVFPNGTPESLKRSKDPIDPYTIILDGKLDSLRPPLKDQIPLEDHFSYMGTAKSLNVKELQKTFFRTGVLQIVSARSRPDAFMTEKTLSNPQEAHPGIVDIKITKVGILWRKDQKKKKARSPWQEWGAILTGAQLYFFRNTTWIKSLIHQYETHLKSGHDGSPLTFNPPLEQFKPDALMSTDGAVALYDMSYKKHKNSFVYVRHGGFEEILLAQSEEDRNDWLAKLNYAAAFRTSGVRMRGLIGGNYEGQGRRAIRRLESSEVTQVIQTPTGEVSINRSRIDQKMAQDILVARREVMEQRISEAEEKLEAAEKHLDSQLQNARHLIILAPIQEKTRDAVRGGAAKIMAQLKWSRTEIWRLKCHRDILQLDLQEDKDVNGDLSDFMVETTAPAEPPTLSHKKSRASSKFSQQQSPLSPPPLLSAQTNNTLEPDSPITEIFQTPPTSSSGLPLPQVQQPHDAVTLSPERPERPGMRKSSISSATSSHLAVGPSATRIPSHLSTTERERRKFEEHPEEDEGERHVLEQAGLLEIEGSHTSDRRPTSSLMASDNTPQRSKTSAGTVADKDRLERSKIRRSLQRTLREGAGHLSHHRGRKGKDSASSGGLAEDTAREDILARDGSFTVHGKKASVIEFGSSLQNMTSEDRIRQRKHSVVDDPILSPASIDDDFHSIIEIEGPVNDTKERRSSAASASTATARSFRELHRKYSTHRGLTVPSDDDSDAAHSFSEGRRSPLPPVEDGSADEEEDEEDGKEQGKTGLGLDMNLPPQRQFYTPEPPSSPVDETDKDQKAATGDKNGAVDRLPSPPIQAVRA